MRLDLRDLRVGDRVRAAFETKELYFHYFGEVVAINKNTVELKTINGCVTILTTTTRIFNDEPAPVYLLKGGKE